MDMSPAFRKLQDDLILFSSFLQQAGGRVGWVEDLGNAANLK